MAGPHPYSRPEQTHPPRDGYTMMALRTPEIPGYERACAAPQRCIRIHEPGHVIASQPQLPASARAPNYATPGSLSTCKHSWMLATPRQQVRCPLLTSPGPAEIKQPPRRSRQLNPSKTLSRMASLGVESPSSGPAASLHPSHGIERSGAHRPHHAMLPTFLLASDDLAAAARSKKLAPSPLHCPPQTPDSSHTYPEAETHSFNPAASSV